MNICFPARKENGTQYASVNEIMDCIGREPHGSWLAGTNTMWHGGIHLTPVTAPGAVLTADNADTAVPLQCMADGEIAAWRVNQDYLKGNYIGKALQYSTSFLLVKSVCKPDPQQESTWLEFYSLYMGLAPLSAYPKRRTMVARTTVLRHPAGCYASSAPADGVADIPPSHGSLNQGCRVIVLKEMPFRNHGEVQPFGLVKCLTDGGEATGEAFLVTLLPEYMTQDGEQYAALPGWMQHALSAGRFDSVVKPSAPVAIAAGDAVGFLQEETDPVGMGKTDTSHFSHIEVLSVDTRMPDFLGNPGKVTTGKKFIQVGLNKPVYIRNGDTFTQAKAMTEKDGEKLLERDKCNPYTSGGLTWYQISPHSWMNGYDVKEMEQFDLAGREFCALVEESDSDMKNSLREGWMRDTYNWLAERINPEKGMRQGMVSRYYRGMMDKLDTDQDGELSGRELFQAIHHPEMGVRKIVSRLVVKHDSEWFGGSSHHKWETFFQNYDPLRINYMKQWCDTHEWMSQVPSFDKGQAIWHMHPVVFLDAISTPKAKGWAHSPFADLLGNVESKNDYTAYNRTWPHPHPKHTEAHYKTNLTSMTLGEVMAAQRKFDMFATGRFQIIPDTLKEAVRVLNLDVNAQYDEAMQDKIFEEYLIKIKRESIINYLDGNGSVEDAIYAWAMEFASAGVRKGKIISKGRTAHIEGVSYYSGDGLNRSHIMPDEMVSILEVSKNGKK
ncbi:hypothetical protein [Enterobacter sp. P82]|uniref:hypothetical protein n=1 Tax=Enterobacter sp. P82 TaxID=3123033 RepID=UPI00300D3C2D